MAQFRGSIQGQRGEASRLGNKSSGLTVEVNGWHFGIKVECRHIDGRDHFRVYKIGGSNGGKPSEVIAHFPERINP